MCAPVCGVVCATFTNHRQLEIGLLLEFGQDQLRQEQERHGKESASQGGLFEGLRIDESLDKSQKEHTSS